MLMTAYLCPSSSELVSIAHSIGHHSKEHLWCLLSGVCWSQCLLISKCCLAKWNRRRWLKSFWTRDVQCNSRRHPLSVWLHDSSFPACLPASHKDTAATLVVGRPHGVVVWEVVLQFLSTWHIDCWYLSLMYTMACKSCELRIWKLESLPRKVYVTSGECPLSNKVWHQVPVYVKLWGCLKPLMWRTNYFLVKLENIFSIFLAKGPPPTPHYISARGSRNQVWKAANKSNEKL